MCEWIKKERKKWLNLFRNWEALSRLAGASQHHAGFAARSRANAFCQRRRRPESTNVVCCENDLSLQSATVPRAFCRQLSHIEPQTLWKQVLRRPHEPHHPKNEVLRTQECFHPWIRRLPNCYTSQLLGDGWLTWWCDWLDGGNAKHDHRPQLGSFPTKLPLIIYRPKDVAA